MIIPAHNAAATLTRAIDSVRAQSSPAHEIIVVDDGSGDDTALVAGRYGDAVKLIRQVNSGVSAARNAGARAASGDWLAFLDADDWYLPDRLKRPCRMDRDGPDACVSDRRLRVSGCCRYPSGNLARAA